MALVPVNIGELCSSLYGFHNIKKDTDVTIECEGQQFLCHRFLLAARSAYFEHMFTNVWRESVTGCVVFVGDHIKAVTLVEVLKYLHMGSAKITLTSSNFMDLLSTSDYLGVLGLEGHCIRVMLQNRQKPIVDLLKVLFFAHSVFNQSLIDVLASCNITERLKEFFETNEFLDIPANLLVIIVSKLWRSPPIMNKVLLRAIHRWQVHAPKEREQQALELYQVLKPASESPLEVHPDFVRVTFAAAPQNPSLYVYTVETPCKIHTYSIDLTTKDLVLEQSFNLDSEINPYSRFNSVNNVGVFSISNLMLNWSSSPILTQFTSANICERGLPLACPPIKLEFLFPSSFEFCNLSNRGLYLMCGYMTRQRNPRYDASKQEFSDDEFKRGIYFYNMQLDRWFPVPAMISRPYTFCMTVDDNIVYVIGSIVQAYDHRERRWHRKPDLPNKHNIAVAQSCVLDGKIYVSSEGYCQRYDPIAARWENVEDSPKKYYYTRKLISYDNQLWQFKGNYVNDYVIEVYDPPTTTWSTTPCFFSYGATENILDAVIW